MVASVLAPEVSIESLHFLDNDCQYDASRTDERVRNTTLASTYDGIYNALLEKQNEEALTSATQPSLRGVILYTPPFSDTFHSFLSSTFLYYKTNELTGTRSAKNQRMVAYENASIQLCARLAMILDLLLGIVVAIMVVYTSCATALEPPASSSLRCGLSCHCTRPVASHIRQTPLSWAHPRRRGRAGSHKALEDTRLARRGQRGA